MNLAEIRKKADETRKQGGGEDVNSQSEPETCEADNTTDGSDASDAVTTEFSIDEYYPDMAFAEEADEEPSGFYQANGLSDLPHAEAELLDSTSPVLEEDDSLSAELAVEPVTETDRAEIETACIVDESPTVAVTVRHPAYDPIAALLAGREAAASEEEAAVEEEHLHVSGDVEEYLCFKVAHEEYALSIMDIKEIIKPREVTEVPRMPRFVSGVISLRGVIIPIMDMRLRLSLPVGETTGRERVLVLRTSVGYCGVIVDEVIQVVRIHNSAIEGPPTILDGIDREFVKGLGRFDNRMLILLNLDSILNLDIR